MYLPMKFNTNEQPANVRYFSAAKNIFINWQQSGKMGLPETTFLACFQTMSAMPDLGKYLFKKFELPYILPGKFTSDPLEGKFGWYRQVSGGNFCMSIKQLMEVEKKIRKLGLLQQHGILSASKLVFLDDLLLQSQEVTSTANVPRSYWLEEYFSTIPVDDLSTDDANVAYFVSGSIGCSILGRRKCLSYKILMVKSDSIPIIGVT